MKSCELCKSAATAYCESDQTRLCWDCDAIVHGANFLAARHVRCLLCHACQSRTPWRATGSKLGYAVSVCQSCVKGGDQEAENDGDEEDDSEDDDVSFGEDVEDGDNQVVPWSSAADTPPPASSSSTEDDSAGETEASRSTNLFSSKRSRGNVSDQRPQEDLHCFSRKRKYVPPGSRYRAEEDGVSVDSRKGSRDRTGGYGSV